jgi:hypothetical protein
LCRDAAQDWWPMASGASQKLVAICYQSVTLAKSARQTARAVHRPALRQVRAQVSKSG